MFRHAHRSQIWNQSEELQLLPQAGSRPQRSASSAIFRSSVGKLKRYSKQTPSCSRSRPSLLGRGEMDDAVVSVYTHSVTPSNSSSLGPYTIDSGDTAFILLTICLIFMMTTGLMLFYAGLVNHKNAVNTLTFVTGGLVTLQWVFFGYSIAFSPGNSIIGSLRWAGLEGVANRPVSSAPTVPHIVICIQRLTFAIITPALISGSIVGRFKFKSYLIFILAWTTLVYDPLAHMTWFSFADSSTSPTILQGFLKSIGFIDFSGGVVVHTSAGVSALVACLFAGKRKDSNSKSGPTAHNVPLVVLGACLMWFGFFGFNGGSAGAANGLAGTAMANTQVGGCTGFLIWMMLESYFLNRTSACGAATGALMGLVSVTPACGFITITASVSIATIGTICGFSVIRLQRRLQLDDTLDVFPCHAVTGSIGTILLGFCSTKSVNADGFDGVLYGRPIQLLYQVIGVLVGCVVSSVGTAIILLIIKHTIGLTVDDDAQAIGIDQLVHGEESYSMLSDPVFIPFSSRNNSVDVPAAESLSKQLSFAKSILKANNVTVPLEDQQVSQTPNRNSLEELETDSDDYDDDSYDTEESAEASEHVSRDDSTEEEEEELAASAEEGQHYKDTIVKRGSRLLNMQVDKFFSSGRSASETEPKSESAPPAIEEDEELTDEEYNRGRVPPLSAAPPVSPLSQAAAAAAALHADLLAHQQLEEDHAASSVVQSKSRRTRAVHKRSASASSSASASTSPSFHYENENDVVEPGDFDLSFPSMDHASDSLYSEHSSASSGKRRKSRNRPAADVELQAIQVDKRALRSDEISVEIMSEAKNRRITAKNEKSSSRRNEESKRRSKKSQRNSKKRNNISVSSEQPLLLSSPAPSGLSAAASPVTPSVARMQGLQPITPTSPTLTTLQYQQLQSPLSPNPVGQSPPIPPIVVMSAAATPLLDAPSPFSRAWFSHYIKKFRGVPNGIDKKPKRVTRDEVFWSCVGSFMGIGIISSLHFHLINNQTELSLILGSFGAGAVLLHAAIASPLAQPRNLILGQLYSAIVGVAIANIGLISDAIPRSFLCALSVSSAIGVMHLTETLHPPGGATALLAVLSPVRMWSGWAYILMPVLAGVLISLLVAVVINNMAKKRTYPQWW